MSLQKNVASQKWIVFAWTIATNVALAGDAAQITANLRLDGGAANAIDDTNPTELEDGYYAFDLSQAETNADNIVICPVSSTGGVAVIGCPMACWTDRLVAVETKVDTIDTVADAIQADLGDFSGRTNNQSLLAVLGVPDVAAKDLHTLLVTDRLDHGTYGLSALETLVDQLEGYCDLIDDATNGLAAIKAEVEGIGGVAMRGTDSAALASAWTSALATILANFSAARIGYLDELAAANLPTDVTALNTLLSSATYGLSALDTDLGTLLTRLSTARAGYLDNLSAGAAALEATLTAIKGTSWSTETLKAIKDAVDAITITAAAIADAVWDELQSGHVATGSFGKQVSDIEEYVDELESGDKPPKKAEFNL